MSIMILNRKKNLKNYRNLLINQKNNNNNFQIKYYLIKNWKTKNDIYHYYLSMFSSFWNFLFLSFFIIFKSLNYLRIVSWNGLIRSTIMNNLGWSSIWNESISYLKRPLICINLIWSMIYFSSFNRSTDTHSCKIFLFFSW